MNMLVPPVVPRPNGPTDAEIIAIVGRAAFENGGFHAARGGVGQIVLSADGSVLQAQTIGSASRPNHQSVTLRAGPDGQVTFRGLCSCSARINCAHVAAALLAARRARILQLPPEARFSPEATITPARAAPVLPANPAPLDYRLVAWLDSLPAARHAESEDYPEDVRHRIFYVLSRQPDGRGVGRLKIEAFTGQLRKDGSIGKNVHPLRLDYGAGRITRTRTMRPSDLLLLARLAQRRGDTPSLEDDPSETLARILATGRARYATPDGPVLAEGPARPGRLVWRMRADGAQLPGFEADAGMPVAVPDPWYLDPDSGTAGPLSLDLPPRLAAKLLDAPPLPPLQAAQVGAELARRLPGLAVPAPQPPPPIEDLTGPPRPVLTLTRGPHPTANPWGPAMPDVPLARLDFRYGPVTLGRARSPAPLTAHGGRLYRVQRDAAREAQALARLGGFGLGAPHVSVWGEREGGVLLPDDTSHAGWLQLLVHALPALRAEGWEVAVAPDFPIRLVTADDDGAIAAEIDSGADGSGIDWLDLHLGVRIDGARVDLVPALVHLIGAFRGELPGAIAAADPAAIFTLPLLDGRILTLQLGRIRPILLALVDLFGAGAIDPDNARLRFTRHEAAELAALEQATPDLVWQGGEAVRELGRQLRAAGGAIPEVALPGTFQGSLRPYQQQGVGWLQFLRAAGLGGVLADDMGLGKTVQTLAHLAIEQAAGRLDRPALIVCPTSLVANWRAEAERFAPGLRLLALHGPERKRDFAAIPACDVVLTTYPLLTRDHAVLAAQAWHILVLDEAQSIKNPLATTTRAVVGLEARQRLCLSGTPLQNHLGELWSLFDFLAPGFLGSARSFRSRYRVPVEKNGDAEARTRLARRVRPFLLRRTKEEVASDLPAKTEIIESVEMEPAQQAMYEAIRLAMHERVREAIAERGLARSGIVILDALLKLRQVCCDPRLVKLRTAHKAGSAKLERLMEMLGELIGQGRRVLLFSQFTSMLDLIIARLHDAGTRFVLLTGDTQDRATPVRRFQAGEVPLFLLSLKAGGTGLNLTAADTVIHYDPWWNPAVEDQATDRAHRIGQSKPVFVHRMVTLGSIEEKMELLKSRKRALVDGILAAEQGGALRLTEADIEALFAA